MNFKLSTELKPQGDQIKAIKELTEYIQEGWRDQVLHGVTGSGKTFTAASVIEKINRPTLVISHNKMLAWQLYQEFKGFFPNNEVHYFVSYYDYYQPEAYIPQTDTYIAKDASINKKIDKMRHAAVQNLLTRKDTIVVASVSCIYNIGSPETYQNVSLDLHQGQEIERRDLLNSITRLGFTRNDIDPQPGNFTARGGYIKIYPSTGESPIEITLNKKGIEEISQKDHKEKVKIFPASFWIMPEDRLKIAMSNIRAELNQQTRRLKNADKDLEAQRLEQKTNYDLETIEQVGYCPGIENYSKHLDFREPGEAPFTLLDYFGENFITFIDESHITIPQIRGMYAGDRARKKTLVQHGFRLPSAIDNRPLKFREFTERVGQTVYMSATPQEYEIEKAGSDRVAEQIVRPTGLLDPPIEVRGTKNQMLDAIKEVKKVRDKNQRALIVTITKRLAEEIAEYIQEEGLNVNYIHSEIHTLKRPEITNKLRSGEYDVLVGVNLLREGLDFPEVSLVLILDADKEGFLRNETTLLQTIGRAARHVEGRAIMYGDKITASMKKTLEETERRRGIQKKFNEEHGITPKSIEKSVYQLPEELFEQKDTAEHEEKYKNMAKKELEKEMKKAAREMDFEKAARIRDEIKKLE